MLAIIERVGNLLADLGETDCEALGGGALAQPVNAITSLSYVVVGVVIAVSAERTGRERPSSFVYAACLAAVGLGSVAFHGPQISGSQIMHDLPILITAIFVLNHDVAVIRRTRRHVWWTFGGAALIATGISVLSAEAATVVTGVVIFGVLVAEVVIDRRGLRDLDRRRQRQAQVAIIAVAAVAGASWLLGRTDSPVCEPDSVIQFHGLWHVISSAIFGLWWWLALADGKRTA